MYTMWMNSLMSLQDEPLWIRWYQIGNVITAVNAKLESELSDMSEYLLASEAAHAGAVVLSRAEETAEEEIRATVTHPRTEHWKRYSAVANWIRNYPKRQSGAHG